MNVSSLKNGALYSPYSTQASYGNTAAQTGGTGSTQDLFSNAEGDSFQLAGDTQLQSAGVYAPPPPSPISNAAQTGSDISSFLDKVANGTVTDTDLQSMQTELQSLNLGTAQDGADDSSDDPLAAFLSKVADGTVTTADLQNMQSMLLQMQNQFGNTAAG